MASDNVDDIKNKVTNSELFKISQLIVNTKYFAGDQRFFVYIWVLKNKVEGKFSKEEFHDACEKYLQINKKKIKEYKEIAKCTDEEAIAVQTSRLTDLYYGNK